MDDLTVKGKVSVGGQEQKAAESYATRDVDEHVKEEQRRLVIDFFFQYHDQKEFLGLLSLPDEHWTFERTIASRRRHSRFLGLNWSWGLLEKSQPWMPGEQPHHYSDNLDCGRIIGFVTTQARSVLCHAGQFLSLKMGEMQGGPKSVSKQARRNFNEKYRRNTAVWLDFNCQISSELNLAAANLPRWLWMFKKRIPAVFSFLAARDDFSCDESRIKHLLSLIDKHHKYRQFVLHHVWRHQSADSPYLSIAGTFDERPTTSTGNPNKH